VWQTYPVPISQFGERLKGSSQTAGPFYALLSYQTRGSFDFYAIKTIYNAPLRTIRHLFALNCLRENEQP
jgi:hypothetical protein